MNGKMLDVDHVQVYHSAPRQATRSAVLLVHEWWGLNDNIKREADGFAEMGYHAVAVDLYDGKVTSDMKVAAQYMSQDKPKASMEKLGKVLRWMRGNDGPVNAGKVATVGWCFGGGYSLRCALQFPEQVTAGVIYYGLLETDVEKLRACRAPLLGVFAKKDQWITLDMVRKFEDACRRAGVALESHVYDSDHAFANPKHPTNHDPRAAADAASKVHAFLHRVLG